MNLKSFLNECSDKEVFKKLSIYLVSSWVLIQVLDIIWKPLGLPSESVTFLLAILFIGFPVNIYLVWHYHLKELEKKNIENQEDIPEENSYYYKKSSFKKMYFSFLTIISVISIFGTLIVLNNAFKFGSQLEPFKENNKIAILKFGNNTGNKYYDIVSKMTSDWIIHGITESHTGQTVSPKVIKDYANILKTSQSDVNDESYIIKKYFKPGKIVTGNIFLKNGKLIFQSSITDGNFDKTLISFKSIKCNKEKPLDCIESLKQLILGYLITEDKKDENLQESPPKFEAYQYVLEAKANLDKPDISLDLLNKAITIDSNYFEPKVLRVANYYNRELFKVADSLRKAIKPTKLNNKRQQNLLNLYQALLEGNNKKTYQTILYEYNNAPFDLESNESAMAVALNKPEDVKAIFDKISMDKMTLQNCIYCEYRIYVKAMADVELKNYTGAIKLLSEIPLTKKNVYLFNPLITAYIRSGKMKSLKNLLDAIKLKTTFTDWQNAYYFAAKELFLQNKNKLATIYFNKLIKSYNKQNQNFIYAKALFYVKNYKAAQNIFETLYKNEPKNIDYVSWLANIYFLNNNKEESLRFIDKLASLKSNYDFGNIAYNLAHYYALKKDTSSAIKYLFNAVAQGKNYTLFTFQNDPIFKDYFKNKTFQKILKYWH